MSAEPPSSSGLPGRHRPPLSDLSRETTEGDLWNLDDDPPAAQTPEQKPAPTDAREPEKAPAEPELPGVEKKKPAPRDQPTPKPVRSPRPTRVDEIGELDEGEAAETEVILGPATEDPPAEAPATPATPEPAAEDAVEAPPAEPKENRPRPAAAPPAAPKAGLSRPRLNRREIIGIAGFAVVVMVAAVWVLTRFFSQLSFKSAYADAPDFPLKGEVARIESAQPFWREPVRDGPDRDVARREVVMIPVLEVTLDPEHSGGGALRVVFRNSQGEPVGDPITRTFAAGRFEASGNATIAFPSTDGFTAEGDFQAYRTGKGESWTADLLEGPSANAPANAFKKLSPIPILPLRR